jgi:hypothetical protein
MVEREPKLFKNWEPYMKARQVMASAILFRSHGWGDWKIGHAKLFGILLWDFETKKRWKFKYSTTLKMAGYQRTHNYRLLNKLVEKNLLQKEGDGYYSFAPEELDLMKRVVLVIKELDVTGREIVTGVERRSEGIAL